MGATREITGDGVGAISHSIVNAKIEPPVAGCETVSSPPMMGGDADFGDHATARAVEAALSATLHALPPALGPPRRGRELWELLRRRWCELTAPWRELVAAGTSWRELLQDLELRLDLDLGSDDSEDREYVRGLFEAEYAEAMSYEGHD